MTTNLHSEARVDAEHLDTPSRALTVAAHPDDAEFGAGGTLAAWSDAGCEISMLILTDGSKGTWDPDIAPRDLAASRQEEQRNAAKVLGVRGEIVFGSHVDGELEHGRQLQAEVALWIRRLRPDVVLGFDPWRSYMLHPDHRAAGWALVDGVVAARDHLFFPEQLVNGLGKHRPSALLLFSAEEPDHYVDISTSFDRKIEALLCHSSQASTTMQDANTGDDQRAVFEQRIRDWSAELGSAVGLELAEAFKLIRP